MTEEFEADVTDEGTAVLPSLSKNTFARLVSDVVFVVLGLISGAITARWLGPSGKGTYAALLYLVSLFGQAATLGTGDASVVLVGRRAVSVTRAAGALLYPVLFGALLGAIALVIFGRAQLETAVPLGHALTIAALSVPLIALGQVWTFVLVSQERVIETSIARIAGHLVTAIMLVLFVVIVPLHITGAVLAVAVGALTNSGIVALLLARVHLLSRPVIDLEFVRKVLHHGLFIQAGYLVMSLTARVDVLIVYALLSRRAAGLYSIASTLGQLVSYAPAALAFASYPRLAASDSAGFKELAARSARLGAAASLVSSAIMLALTPITVRYVFGEPYLDAIPAAYLLILGGMMWSGQWILCRAFVARGQRSIQFMSFATSLGCMVVLDYILIPRLGISGAAIASSTAALVGFAIALIPHARMVGLSGLRNYLPRTADFNELLAFSMRVLRRLLGL